eukprot:comp19799_c0_seq1/m.23772 comp19799_c0_seq1/g.23772  ORF comp19799_c0_seq1/g.23772 comp19799_c0_seq1/m.23772 type:complete len:365 (-) comp19799_c0_seq1:169-1263(-)
MNGEQLRQRLKRPVWAVVEPVLLKKPQFSFSNPRPWSSISQQGECDRFTVELPHCSICLKCDIVFDGGPWFPPDIIVYSPEEEFTGEVDLEVLFQDYDPRNSECLLLVLDRLSLQYAAYKKRQVDDLEDRSIIEQLNTLTAMGPIDGVDVNGATMMMGRPEDGKPTVEAVFPVTLDISELPPCQRAGRTHIEGTIGIIITLTSPLKTQVALTLPEPLSDIKAPAWVVSQMYMHDYLSALAGIIRKKIATLREQFETRRMYAAHLLRQFGHCVAEFDVANYDSITFVIKGVIVHIELPPAAPKQPYSFILHSLATDKVKKQPITKVHKAHHNESWDLPTHCEKLKAQLQSAIPSFITEVSTKALQ